VRHIRATVITGFLGADKISLVRHLAAQRGGWRLAIIVDEFGELGIDRGLMLGCCHDECTVETANSCLCCAVADDFLPALHHLPEALAPREHVLMRPSALALPKPLIQAFAWPEFRPHMAADELPR
jgi:cobalamin biosynthesis protein CobW